MQQQQLEALRLQYPPHLRRALLTELKRRVAQNRLLDFKPYAKQLEFYAAGRDYRERLLRAGNQLGKALRHGTLVWTPHGMVPIESIKVGDRVIGGDGNPCTVTGVYPQGVKPILRFVFDRGEQIECCEDHLWLTLPPAARYEKRWSRGKIEANPRFGRWEVMRAADILEAAGPEPKARRRHVMPACGVIEMDAQPVPVDPYLMGVLLGDGCFTNGVSFSSADEEIVLAVEAALPEGVSIKRRNLYDHQIVVPGGRANGAKATGNPLTRIIESLGLKGKLSYDKFVPGVYLHNSSAVRLAVLQGLMDTDGSVSADGMIEYSTTSEALAQAVTWLAQSFGCKVGTQTRVTSYTHEGERKQGAQSWRIRIRPAAHTPPLFRLERKANRVLLSDRTCDYRVLHRIERALPAECTCISVDSADHTFVIEHGIVTHNTLGVGAEVASHLTGRYPNWWPGRVWNRPIVSWVAGVTSESTRDNPQRILVGRVNAQGTGMIPADAIKSVKKRAHGAQDAIDYVVVRHGGGGDVQAGESLVFFKSYDQGREKFQGESIDLGWGDEEPPIDVYTEFLTRTNAPADSPGQFGSMLITFTPLQGMSETVARFLLEKPPGTFEVNMTIDDVDHYTPEQKAQVIASYPAHEREARAKGIPTMGSGKVFPVEEALIEEGAIEIPDHWPRIAAMDFGWDHPTAVVWGAWDRDTDTVHIYDAYRLREQPPAVHASAIKARGEWIPVAWPHDGNNDTAAGPQLSKQYRDLGVAMLPKHAQFMDTSHDNKEDNSRASKMSVEAGVASMLTRMTEGRLKVAKHLNDWWEEFRLYHRKDGKIVRIRDDLMSATRYLEMSLDKAITPPVQRSALRNRPARNWRI